MGEFNSKQRESRTVLGKDSCEPWFPCVAELSDGESPEVSIRTVPLVEFGNIASRVRSAVTTRRNHRYQPALSGRSNVPQSPNPPLSIYPRVTPNGSANRTDAWNQINSQDRSTEKRSLSNFIANDFFTLVLDSQLDGPILRRRIQAR